MKHWMIEVMKSYRVHLTNSSTPRLETQNSALSILIGLCFLSTSLFTQIGMYERYPDIYKYMEWAPAWTWGIVYFSAGVLHLIALYSRWHWHRKHILWAKAGLWLFIALCVLQVDVFAPSGWIYLVLSYSAIMAYLRIKLKKEGPTNDTNVLGTY